jgi:hypothetical protein
VSRREIGRQTDGVGKSVNRLNGIARLLAGHTQLQVRPGVRRVRGDRISKRLPSRSDFVELEVRNTQIEVGGFQVGLQSDRPFERSNCFCRPAEVRERDAEADVGTGKFRLNLGHMPDARRISPAVLDSV